MILLYEPGSKSGYAAKIAFFKKGWLAAGGITVRH